jgi:hypothetical protein
MATRALTPDAQRRSRDDVSARKDSEPARDWREVLLSQDAEAIWHKLSILVRSAAPDHAAGYEQLTQDLFLELLATDRVRLYVEREYSDSEITADLNFVFGG